MMSPRPSSSASPSPMLPVLWHSFAQDIRDAVGVAHR